MSFNQTLVYLLLLFVFYNVLDYLRLRWKAERKSDVSKQGTLFANSYLVAGVVSLSVLLFVLSSCYFAYKGFLAEYSHGMSLVGTSLFAFGGLVLIRSTYRAVKELPTKSSE